MIWFSRVSEATFYNQLISGEISMNDATLRLKNLNAHLRKVRKSLDSGRNRSV